MHSLPKSWRRLASRKRAQPQQQDRPERLHSRVLASMLRRHRSFILTGFGFLALAASPPQERRQAQHNQAEQGAAVSLERIARTTDRNNEAAHFSPECPEGTENRRSDLCAQWKAADAAYESAAWSRRTFHLGIWGLAVGFLTLGAAAAAAYFASEQPIIPRLVRLPRKIRSSRR